MFPNDISHNGELNEDVNPEENNSFDEEDINFEDTESPDDEPEEDKRPRLQSYLTSAPAFRRYSSLW